MHIGTNKRRSWLVRWLRIKACIPNIAGKGGRGEIASTGKSNRFL